jgi:hypothetical protein
MALLLTATATLSSLCAASCVGILGDFEPGESTATSTNPSGGGGGVAGTGGTTGGTSSVGGTTAGGGGAGGGCENGLTPCGDGCIDTDTTATDCGTCGHDCGGGECSAGHCQPVTLAAELASVPWGVAAAGNAVFWSRSGRVESCPAVGCGGDPPTLIDDDATKAGQALAGTNILSDGNFVQWLAYTTNTSSPGFPGPVLYGCHAAGCGGSNPTLASATSPMEQLALRGTTLYASIGSPGGSVRTCTIGACSGDPLSTVIPSSGADPGFGIAADDEFVYFSAGGDPVYGGALKCPITGCPTPSSARIQLFKDARWLALVDGTLYSITSGDALVGCSVDGCGGQPTQLATAQAGATALVADVTGAYFAIGGSTTAADGELRVCTLPSCEAGPTALVTGQARPVSLALAGGFLYWANAGLDGQTATTAAIMRIRL